MLLRYLEFALAVSALVAAHGSHSSHQADDGETDWAVWSLLPWTSSLLTAIRQYT